MSLEDKLKALGCLVSPVLVVGGGVAGAVVGTGLGYLVGNVIDFIPLVNKVAPWIADYVGFTVNDNINEDFYQLSLGVSGTYKGITSVMKWLAPNDEQF